jgi:hypothetical protein
MGIANRVPRATLLGLAALLRVVGPTSAAAQPASRAESAAGSAAVTVQQLDGTKESTPPEPVVAVPESAESLWSRVRDARRIAAEERRKALAMAPSTEGLTQSQLEIRGGERNLSIYDMQLLRGEATPAIESFRNLTASTLAELRRKELWRVWGNAIFHPEAFDVLGEHGRAMAELRRIQSLARFKGLSSAVKQCDALMREQDLGFEREMRRMRDEVRDNPSFARLSIELRQQAARDARQ